MKFHPLIFTSYDSVCSFVCFLHVCCLCLVLHKCRYTCNIRAIYHLIPGLYVKALCSNPDHKIWLGEHVTNTFCILSLQNSFCLELKWCAPTIASWIFMGFSLSVLHNKLCAVHVTDTLVDRDVTISDCGVSLFFVAVITHCECHGFWMKLSRSDDHWHDNDHLR